MMGIEGVVVGRMIDGRVQSNFTSVAAVRNSDGVYREIARYVCHLRGMGADILSGRRAAE